MKNIAKILKENPKELIRKVVTTDLAVHIETHKITT